MSGCKITKETPGIYRFLLRIVGLIDNGAEHSQFAIHDVQSQGSDLVS